MVWREKKFSSPSGLVRRGKERDLEEIRMSKWGGRVWTRIEMCSEVAVRCRDICTIDAVSKNDIVTMLAIQKPTSHTLHPHQTYVQTDTQINHTLPLFSLPTLHYHTKSSSPRRTAPSTVPSPPPPPQSSSQAPTSRPFSAAVSPRPTPPDASAQTPMPSAP